MANITLQEAYNRAKEALEAGEIDRAVAICQYVLRYYPRYVEGYRLLGEAYLEHGGLSEAGRLFSHVLSCDPQHVLAHVGRAIIAEEHGLAEVAISELERGFEVDPSIGELRAELLRLYKVRYGTAGAYIRTTPIGLAYTHLRAGLLEPAIAEFSRLAEAQPDRWDAQVALLEALWRNEQVIDAANLATAILADHPNCVKANWILGYLHWTGDKLDTGREYLSAAVALDPDYGTARKLWANTPWPLDPVVTAEQPALVPGWARDELVMEEDLNLALPMALDEEPLATTPSRAITTKLADEAAATSPYRTAELSEEAAAAALATIAAPGLDEEPDGLAGGALDVILPMPEAGAESPLPEPTSLLDTVLAVPAIRDAAPPPEEPEASAAEPPPPPGAWFQQWAQAALNPAPAPPPAPPAEETIAPADSPVMGVAAPGAADTVLPVADAAPSAPEDEAPASPLDVATIAPAEAETAGEPPRPAAEMEPVLTIVPPSEDQPPAPAPDQPAAGAAPAAAQPAPPAPLELALEPGAEAGAAAGEDEALLTETGEAPIHPAAPLAGEPEPAPLLDETIGAPAPGESAEEAPPAASPEPPAEVAAAAAAQVVGPPLAEATPAAAAARPSAPPPTSHDAPTTPAPDEGHQSAPILETVADSAMKENTMAPSYKEDDDQERQFEFDWEREGLPDYLKPFLAEDSGAPAPVPPAPAAPAPPGDREAAASGSAGADSELPDWLSAPPSNVPTAPAAPVPPSFGPAPTAGMGGFSAPEAQAGSAGGIDLDQEGLPDWLRPSPAQPPAPPPAAPPPSSARSGNLDDEGLPSWLQSGSATTPPPAPAPFNMGVSDNMDNEGLPSWLQSGPAAPPPAPTPQGAPGAAQPFDFGQMGGVQPFDFGASAAPPPPQGGLSNVQPFDFGQMSEDLSGVQPFAFGATPPGGAGGSAAPDFGATPPPAQAPRGGMSDIEPFDFGQMSGVQPFDFNAPPAAPAAPAPPADLGNVQPFAFDQMGGEAGGGQRFDFGATAPPPAAPGGQVQPFDFGQLGSDLGDVQPFDFGAAVPPAQAGAPGNVQPFDFGTLSQPAQPGHWAVPPSDEADDFLDYLNASEGAPAAGAAPGPGATPPGGVQPFAFDSGDFGTTIPPAPPSPPVAIPPPPTEVAPFNPEEFNFQPFSFGQEPAPGGQGAPAAFGTGGMTGLEGLPDIQPFSFEDMHLDLPTGAGGESGSFGRRAGDRSDASFDDEAEEESHGYSWQRPSGGTPRRRGRPEEEAAGPAEESIFAKARRRKEELEAAMRAEMAGTDAASTGETAEPIEPTDLWPTFDEEEAAAAATAVPTEPAVPLTPVAAVSEAGAAVEAFDFSTLESEPAGAAESAAAFDMTTVQPFDFSAFAAEPEIAPFDFTSLDTPPAEPVPASPPPAETGAFDFGSVAAGSAEVPGAATPDLTPGQPEQLWSVPGEPVAAEAGRGGEFDFSGLPRFDLAEMGLTPEEQAYLLNDSAVSSAGAEGTEAAAVAPAQPPAAEAEALPSWLSGEATPAPSIGEPLAELESNALPSWMGSAPPAETPPAAEAPVTPWPAAAFGEPEPLAAEVFGEEDMQAWPAPAEPAAAPAPEAEAPPAEETTPAAVPAAPAFAGPEPMGDAPTLEERITPEAPALPVSGELETAEEIRYNPPLPAGAAPVEATPAEAVPLRPAASLPAPAAPGRESIDDLLRRVEDNPNDVAARLVLAGVYEERQDYRRALDQYRLLIKSREVPDHVLDLVLDNLRTFAEDMPDDAAVHRVLGDAYRKAGMFQAAISQYNWLLTHGTK